MNNDYDPLEEIVNLPPQTEPPRPQEGVVPLGHDRGIFFYYSHATGQIWALKASEHSKPVLLGMASLAHYWEYEAIKDNKSNIQWDATVAHLMDECRKKGIFDLGRIRGRGAWIDNGKPILHLGDKLLVHGQETGLTVPGSRYIYEMSQPMLSVTAPALTVHEAHALVEICKSLRWERDVSGLLMAGFLAVAPICGGLAWRPSIWVTGGAGSGKSWLNDNIMRPVLGDTALMVQSKTTEAGLRQMMGADARPVVFDEAESEDQASAARIQSVLDLMRQASSESSGSIVKGSQNQSGAKSYKFRACFAFSSINAMIQHHADESRLTLLAMRELRASSEDDRRAAAEAFEKLNKKVIRTLTPEFSAGLVARSVALLPVIRQNAEIFARMVAVHLGSRRDGDQLGTLLAGAYSLHSDRVITEKQAMDIISKYDWNRAVSRDADRDEVRLVSHITQHRIRIFAGQMATDVTVGQIIDAAFGREEKIVPENAETELRAMGIKTGHRDGVPGLYVSTSHPTLKKILAGTPWSAGWSRALARLPGAENNLPAPVRFGTGHKTRAAWVPLAAIEGDD